METLHLWLKEISAFVWGVPLIVLLGGTGIFLTIRLRFLQVTFLARGFRLAFGSRGSPSDPSTPGDISRFQALMTTSAATIGTGNIVGVSTALAAGGPGALFWMWIIAVLGMATKYAEAVLAVKFRSIDNAGNALGGPMLYLERGVGKKWLAVAFSLFGAAAAFGIGNTVQANAVAENVRQLTGITPWITGPSSPPSPPSSSSAASRASAAPPASSSPSWRSSTSQDAFVSSPALPAKSPPPSPKSSAVLSPAPPPPEDSPAPESSSPSGWASPAASSRTSPASAVPPSPPPPQKPRSRANRASSR